MKNLLKRPKSTYYVRRSEHNLAITAAHIGCTSLYWPGIEANKPTFSYGITRSHDWTKDYLSGGGCFAAAKWNNVETSDGVFSWTDIDLFVNSHLAVGREVILTIDGTPSFFVAAPVGAGVYRNTAGVTQAGTNMPPDDLGKWSRWCTQLATRYGATVHYEIWNEPQFTGGTSGYWIGTAEQLATMMRLAYQAIKAVAPTAIVICPSITGDPNRLVSLLAASDGASGTGASWFDVCGFHFYDIVETLQVDHSYELYDRVRLALNNAGRTSAAIWNTESGAHSFFDPTTIANASAADRRIYYRRWVMALLALGVHRTVYYAADNSYGLKKPADTGATYDMSPYVTELATEMIGKTLVRSNIGISGGAWNTWVITLSFSDGSSVISG